MRQQTLSRSSAICITIALFLMPTLGFGQWTMITKPPTAPNALNTMLLTPDGAVMILSGDDNKRWVKLSPDKTGSYANGKFRDIKEMSIGRRFFASEVLPDGRIWVLGGEYTGPYLTRTDIPSGEIYDPAANAWSAITPYPDQAGCPANTDSIASDVKLVTGKKVVTDIFSTYRMQAGWTVAGPGIPAGTTIVSVDSDKKVTISNAATITGPATRVTFSGTASSCYGAVPAILLPGGKKILAGDLISQSTYIYSIDTDSWAIGTPKFYNDPSDEESWAKFPDEKVLTYDISTSNYFGNPNNGGNLALGGYAELYNPANMTWTDVSTGDGSANGFLPFLSSDALGSELGAMLRLHDGKMLQIGGNQHNALYDVSTNTWAAGPDTLADLTGPGGTISNANFGSDDAPAAILPNGHVITVADAGPNPITLTGTATTGSYTVTFASPATTAGLQVGWPAQGTGFPNTTIFSVDSSTQVTLNDVATVTGSVTLTFGGTFSSPAMLFEYDPKKATITPLASPAGSILSSGAAYTNRLLILPTGELLLNDSQNLFVYTPSGSAPANLIPVVDTVTYQGAGVFLLSGKKLNGQSAGSNYGDDVSTDENFPIVRLVNAKGDVFYCTTSNWSNTRVGDGPVDVNFTLDPKITTGNYTLYESGAGLTSVGFPITITSAEVSGQ
jgi:hypothetical protein